MVAPLLIGEQAHKADAALPSSRVSVLLSQMLCKVDPLLNVFRKPGVLPACGILCLLPLTLLCVSQNVAMRPKTLPNARMLFAFFFFFYCSFCQWFMVESSRGYVTCDDGMCVFTGVLKCSQFEFLVW